MDTRNDLLDAETFLSEAGHRQVEQAIAEAERATSGEIRVHLEDLCEEDVLDHAAFLFTELGMHRTARRNGVLIYVSVVDHQLAVIGDAGINAVVPEGFWRDVVAVLRIHFAAGRHAEGLCEAVRLIGEKLRGRFPYEEGDTDELTNTISIGR